MTYIPTPEAIQAVARFMYEQDNDELYKDAKAHAKIVFDADATRILMVAAPLIAAQAKAEAWDRCVNHIIASCTYVTSTAELWRHERLYSDLCTVRDSNPYRAATIEGKSA